MRDRSADLDRLSAFTLLWAVATLIHQASFTGWISLNRPLGWGLTALASMAVIWPRSIALFTAMVGVSALYTMQRLPNVPNHILFELFVSLTILLGVALGWLDLRRRQIEPAKARDHIYSSFAATVRIELLLLYFFVTLHKLNRDFFDPQVSCGGALFNMMVDNAPRLAEASWVQIGCIGATIAFEAGIPLLLLFRKTRALGILTGFFFHLVLGFVPHGGVYSFSALMMTLYFLFTPPELTQSLSRWLHAVLGTLPLRRYDLLYRTLATGAIALTWGVWYWGWHRAGYLSLAKVGFAHWLAWSALLLTLFLIAFRFGEVSWDGFDIELRPSHRLLWLLPLLITMNGLSPYLGSKTQTSFAMFSNLRTEDGRPNHFFLGWVPQIWGYQRDIVEVVQADNELFDELRQQDLRLPFFQFQRYVGRAREDFEVVFRRNQVIGQLRKVDGKLEGDLDSWPPVSYLARKWLRFRPFDAGPKMGCRH